MGGHAEQMDGDSMPHGQPHDILDGIDATAAPLAIGTNRDRRAEAVTAVHPGRARYAPPGSHEDLPCAALLQGVENLGRTVSHQVVPLPSLVQLSQDSALVRGRQSFTRRLTSSVSSWGPAMTA